MEAAKGNPHVRLAMGLRSSLGTQSAKMAKVSRANAAMNVGTDNRRKRRAFAVQCWGEPMSRSSVVGPAAGRAQPAGDRFYNQPDATVGRWSVFAQTKMMRTHPEISV